MRFSAILVGLCATASSAFGQSRWTSAPIGDVAYEVTADSAAVGRRELTVAMTFHVDGTAPVVLALPAWSPGHYVLLWFAQRVIDFSATSNGAPLAWRKLDFQTWRVEPHGAGTMRVAFRYRADVVDRAIAWTSRDFAFFNGTNLFMYPAGRGFDWSARVTVHTEPQWRVATGMDPAAAPNTFTAKNYHDLVDMPFYVGRFAIDSTLVSGHWFRLAMYPAASMTPARRDRTLGWLQKLVPPEAAVFGEIPFRTYTVFQRSDTLVNGGGLEHSASQVDEVHVSQLDSPGLFGLYAHELFHAWNVKRLRPADLVPYRYDDAQQSSWLWVSEGVTDYYGAVAQVRSGLIDSSGFFGFIAGDIATVASVPATALSDASYSAWIGAFDGSAGLYYPKGGLAGFLLDIMIRDASDNRKSLDDVMGTLYATTYKHGKGFTSGDWWGAIQHAAGGKSFSEFARRYVDGREPLPVDSVLALAALRVLRDTIREPRLGLQLSPDTSGAIIASIVPGGAAADAGAQPGDRFVSIGDVPIANGGSFDRFRARYANSRETTLPALVQRGEERVTLQLPVRLAARARLNVVPLGDASAKAIRVRDGILRGVTQRGASSGDASRSAATPDATPRAARARW